MSIELNSFRASNFSVQQIDAEYWVVHPKTSKDDSWTSEDSNAIKNDQVIGKEKKMAAKVIRHLHPTQETISSSPLSGVDAELQYADVSLCFARLIRANMSSNKENEKSIITSQIDADGNLLDILKKRIPQKTN